MHTVTVDDRKRVRLPTAEPGQVFSFESERDGSIKLVPLKPPVTSEPRRIKAKLIRRGNALVFEAKGIKIDPEAISQAVREERASRA